jgi:adenylosuccinate synthase
MPATVVVGCQWGDEGKARIVDELASGASMVVRYQGGSNAGHTVDLGDQVVKLHQVPSGVVREGVWAVLGNGMVLHPPSLIEELDALEERGFDTSHVVISGNAHLVMPYHRLLERAEEQARGVNALGTTGLGIGPAYTDKVARRGIRMRDALSEARFSEKVRSALARVNPILQHVYGHEVAEPGEIIAEYQPALTRLAPYVTDTALLIHRELRAGGEVVFEGAQATLLDLDHGTYPFLTSSTPTAGGACSGAGVGPTAIDRVVGVTKAYTTRVGNGPFPTELHDELGDWLVEKGHEYGTTTGRRRRCGWLDAVLLRYAARVNGLSRLALTKLDILTGLPKLRICVAYECNGRLIDEYLPVDVSFDQVKPVYEEMPGWEEPIQETRVRGDLPKSARDYLERVETLAGVPIEIVSVGPRRNQTVRVG